MVGGRGDFRLGGLEKLLVSAVHEFGDFATDQIAGIREYLHAIVAIFLNPGEAMVFLRDTPARLPGPSNKSKTLFPNPVHPASELPFSTLAYHRVFNTPSRPI